MDCDVVQDLLPLYQDDACSEGSKKMIEKHLQECAVCQKVEICLKNIEVDDKLATEKNDVLQKFAKKERKRTFTAGVVTAAVLMVPVIVCLICNLVIGQGLDWFFIVLASLCIFASFTVVPLMIEKNVGLWTLGSFTGSLLFLLLVVDIYVGGGWFFVAATSIVFGLSVLFAPYVVKRMKLSQVLTNKKGLLVMSWDTAWLFAIILVANWGNTSVDYWKTAASTTLYGISFPWLLFLILRYGKMPGALQNKMHGLIKSGLCVIIIGTYATITNNVINALVGGGNHMDLSEANFANWSSTSVINANIHVLILLSAIGIGSVLIIAGIIAQRIRNRVEG